MDLINNDQLQWKRFVGDNKFDYPINYSTAVLDVNENGHINLLTKWEPNSYCHFHRHTATSTTSTVLQGELYVCLLYTSPSPRDKRQSRMPSSA